MKKNNDGNRRQGLARAAAGSAVAVFALLGASVTPAAAERVQPEGQTAAAVTVDIVESVLERKLKIAADRVARPGAYGSTWRG